VVLIQRVSIQFKDLKLWLNLVIERIKVAMIKSIFKKRIFVFSLIGLLTLVIVSVVLILNSPEVVVEASSVEKSAEVVVEAIHVEESAELVVETIPVEKTSVNLNHSLPSMLPISIYAIASSLALVLAVLLSVHLYRWRKIFLSKPDSLVPKEWEKVLNQVAQTVEKNQLQTKEAISRSESLQTLVFKKSEQTLEAFMSLHKVLEEKDKEIERLKHGYDSYVYKKFLKRFLKANIATTEMLEENPEDDQLKIVQSLLTDALQECDVEEFEPIIGSDYRDAQGVADGPKIIETVDLGKDFTIAEIIDPGYQVRSATTPMILLEAKVTIYRMKKEVI